MAIVVESVSTNAMGTGGVLTKPTGLAVGDLLLAIVVAENTANLASPGGWTGLGSAYTATCAISNGFYKVADSGDVSASDFTFTGTDIRGGILYRISGASITHAFAGTGNPEGLESLVILWGVQGDNDGSSGSVAASSVTGGASVTFTARLNSSENTGISTAFGVGDGIYSSGDAITAFSVSFGGGMDESASQMIVIPAVANATGTNALLSVSPTLFNNAGVDVGGNGTNALLEVEPEFFDQSGNATSRTEWVNEPKPSTSWNNETYDT